MRYMIFKLDLACFPRSVLPLVLTVTLSSMGGCVSRPAPLSPEQRMQLGRVGIFAVYSSPRVEFNTFAKGWAAGAAKGGAFGLVDGLIRSLNEALRNQSNSPYAVPTALITAAVLTTVSTVIYGVAGGLEAVPGKKARQIEQELNAAIGDVNLASDLAEKIYAVSGLRPESERYAVTVLGLSLGIPSALGDLSKQGIRTAMEVQVTEAGFRGGSGSEPSVSFYLNARIRLLATETGTEIYTRDFQYLSRQRPFEQWFTDGSRELLAGFKQAMVTLGDRIVDELFIVTNFPFDSGLWAFPGQPEFGSCWFRPIYPELKYTSLWHSIQHNSPGINIRYTEVDSLQPLLRWEAFPRPRDQKPSNESLLAKIADVTYDIKIWEETGDYPERLVYDISGLVAPQYRPAFPLAPMTKYFWTFRARYKMAGQSQVTRWSFSNIPSNVPSDYPRRQPGGSCDLDAIPSTNYFRFITP